MMKVSFSRCVKPSTEIMQRAPTILLLMALLMFLLSCYYYVGVVSSWFSAKTHLDCSQAKIKDLHVELLIPEGTQYNQPNVTNTRTDVVMVTPWLSPIVWEGTFDQTVIEAIYKKQEITVAATVFALGKYTRFLRDFLETAERNFFVDYRVHYYVFTDRPGEVPAVPLGPGRNLTVLLVAGSNRWQEITLRRMERIERLIEEHLTDKVEFIFSLDVDCKFHNHWGAESLSDIVGTLHPGYYGKPRNKFPYERRPRSKAYIQPGEGDYYYGGAVIGGRVDRVLKLTRACRTQLDLDRENNIEAVWQEESHLNKYFLYNKPTKVLSPEYLWQDYKPKTPNMKVIRLSHVRKKYSEVRPSQ